MSSKRVLLISHEREAPAAVVGAILEQRGFVASTHVVLDNPAAPNVDFPDPADFDLVVAFGSFYNAYDPAAQHWIAEEIRYISRLTETQTGYFGVCFGAQLLGRALGGTVTRLSDGAEVGTISVEPATASAQPLKFPAGPWFSWHEDQIELPPEVEVLAATNRSVQVFQAPRAIGVQFHPEATMQLVSDWVAMGADHLPPEWSPEKLVALWAQAEPEAHRNCVQLVDWVIQELDVDSP
jgi:GMP synthase (glutamine-hydrolysing)